MSTVFDTNLELPDLDTHTIRGGGYSILLFPVDDAHAPESSGKWNLLSMLTNRTFDVAESGGTSKSDLTLTLLEGTKYTMSDSSSSESADTETEKIVTAMSSLGMANLKNASKGQKYFFVIMDWLSGTDKYVKFGYGTFARNFSRSQDYGAISAWTVTINFEAYTGTTPTFPTLPASSDTQFTTPSDETKKYLGWIFGSTDAAKGGFGTAVTMVTGTDLPAGVPTVVKKF